MKTTKPQTTPTPRANLSTVDWDALDRMEPDEAQASQEINLPSVPRSSTSPEMDPSPVASPEGPVTAEALMQLGYSREQAEDPDLQMMATHGGYDLLLEEYPPAPKV